MYCDEEFRMSKAYLLIAFIAVSSVVLLQRYKSITSFLDQAIVTDLNFELPLQLHLPIHVSNAENEANIPNIPNIPSSLYDGVSTLLKYSTSTTTNQTMTTTKIDDVAFSNARANANANASQSTIHIHDAITHPNLQNLNSHHNMNRDYVNQTDEVPRQEDPVNQDVHTDLDLIRNLSSVDYFSCCGLGHRMSKNTDAYFVAKLLNFGLRFFWGFCQDTEVAQYLFGPTPVSKDVTRVGETVRLNNEVHGFKKLIREGNATKCKCSQEKHESDIEYYTSMRNRFRFKRRLERFRREVFANHTVLGMHIRAGNNETGDFQKKNRLIHDVDSWVNGMVRHLTGLAQRAKLPPILYLATDTPSLMSRFRRELQGIMQVVDFPQERTPEGAGVAFGSRGAVLNDGQQCLEGWRGAVMDMILLSHADVVIAARPSSFVQTMPMVMRFATPKGERVFQRPFCEVNYNATDMNCYETFMEWCCESVGQFFFGNINQRYDYLRYPYDVWEREYTINSRIDLGLCEPGPRAKADCLPYDWPKQVSFEEKHKELYQ